MSVCGYLNIYIVDRSQNSELLVYWIFMKTITNSYEVVRECIFQLLICYLIFNNILCYSSFHTLKILQFEKLQL